MLFSIAAIVALVAGSVSAQVNEGTCYYGYMTDGVRFTDGNSAPAVFRDGACLVEDVPQICVVGRPGANHLTGYVRYNEEDENKYKWLYKNGVDFSQDKSASEYDLMYFTVGRDESGRDYFNEIAAGGGSDAYLPFRGQLISQVCESEYPNYGDFSPNGTYIMYLTEDKCIV